MIPDRYHARKGPPVTKINAQARTVSTASGPRVARSSGAAGAGAGALIHAISGRNPHAKRASGSPPGSTVTSASGISPARFTTQRVLTGPPAADTRMRNVLVSGEPP